MKKKAPIIPQQYEGDILMATSSIFSNVVIRSEKSARAFVRAFEACQKNPDEIMSTIDVRKASDPANIEMVMKSLNINK